MRPWFRLLVTCVTLVPFIALFLHFSNYLLSVKNTGVHILLTNRSLPIRAPYHCTYSTCFNASLCAYEYAHRPLNRIGVFVYSPAPSVFLDENGQRVRLVPSKQHVHLLRAISTSRYAVSSPLHACVFIPDLDLLNGADHRFDVNLRILNSLPWWNNGTNHLLFNIIPGNSRAFLGLSMVAGARHSVHSYRPTFDVSIPAFNPFTSQYISEARVNRSFLLTVFPTHLLAKQSARERFLSIYRCPEFAGSRSIVILESVLNYGTSLDRYSAVISHSPYADPLFSVVSYTVTLSESIFCAITTPGIWSRFYLYDAMKFGCIPVIVPDQFVLPFSEVLDWSRLAVRIRQEQIEEIPKILTSYSSIQIRQIQRQLHFIFERYFATLEKIALTTLDIINDRVYPYYARSYFQWNDASYSETIFPAAPALFYPTRVSSSSGFTAVVRGHYHFGMLRDLLIGIQTAPSLQRIIVVWTNTKNEPPATPLWPIIRVPLSVVQAIRGLANDRYYPYRQIQTEAILSLDDSACAPSVAEIQLAFELWCENPDRLIGFSSARLLPWNTTFATSPIGSSLSSASFGASFFHKHYLHLYTELISNQLQELVNSADACEDLVMNWLIVQLSGRAVLTALPKNYVLKGGDTTTETPGSCHRLPYSTCWRRMEEMSGKLNAFLSHGRQFKIAPLNAISLLPSVNTDGVTSIS
ncbi:unnamed protein product [Calicophoron daubneyi]|uniref:Uncharacterized protein n=1 Tax=Calicophoron daubneyi TaxID=300641 RepID=A0AAV2TWI4_CALDB